MRSQQQIMSNFRTLFSPYSRPSPLASTSRAQGLPLPARRSAARPKQAYKPETYTREFFCLASSSQTTTPNREEKETLQCTGLGIPNPRNSNKSWSKRFESSCGVEGSNY
jgi:hypothetical protein